MIRTVIFDWSGTLSDDCEAVYLATMDVFRHYGRPPVSLDQYRREFVLPYMDYYYRNIPEIDRAVADDIFRRRFPEYHRLRIFPGAAEALARLAGRGITLAVLSAHYREKLEEEVAASGLAGRFARVEGGVANKIETLPRLVREAGYDPAASVYVGDMRHDIQAARAAGITPVAVAWGYEAPEVLRAAGATRIVNSVAELGELD
jgi:phosphoglycolate phosphatase